ncbi:MAG: VWA domain-containing protein [Edaphocola sp.]
MSKCFGSAVAVLLSIIFAVNPFCLSAQEEQEQRPARILFLIDASSSMSANWAQEESRFQAAGRIVMAVIDSVHTANKDVAFAVRVFGNQFPAQDKNCYDTRLEVPFRLQNDEQIRARLQYLRPLGYSPIAWSLKETAENDFVESNLYAYSIILITDGGESCGGDICATVTNLLKKKISFRPYILSLIDDEPLKLQYECLGKYLTVAKEQDIVPAVKTILNDNKRVLSIKASTSLRPVATTPPPAARKIAVQPVPIVATPLPEEPKRTPAPKDTTPAMAVSAPPKPAVTVAAPAAATPSINRPSPLDRIAAITQLRRMNLLYTLPDGKPVAVPQLNRDIVAKFPPDVGAPPKDDTKPNPVKKFVEPKVSDGPHAKVAGQTLLDRKNNKPTENLSYEVREEPSKESSLQVYFVNANGKQYNTEPKMIIKDAAKGTEVKSVFRNVSGGVPVPVKMNPGTYNIELPGSKARANNIVIEAGKNKKVYIQVSTGSLAFYYPSAPDRPAVEYRALVSKRFEPGPVVKHPCDSLIPYQAANYHIEVNTLPPLTYNVDLDFNNITLVALPEPGTMHITNTERWGKVQFFQQLGDSFVPFYEMEINGNAATQKASFLPGIYQVRYITVPGAGSGTTETIRFRIKSNMTTSIELTR